MHSCVGVHGQTPTIHAEKHLNQITLDYTKFGLSETTWTVRNVNVCPCVLVGGGPEIRPHLRFRHGKYDNIYLGIVLKQKFANSTSYSRSSTSNQRDTTVYNLKSSKLPPHGQAALGLGTDLPRPQGLLGGAFQDPKKNLASAPTL